MIQLRSNIEEDRCAIRLARLLLPHSPERLVNAPAKIIDGSLQVTIRRGTVADAAMLADLARAIFIDTFGPDNDPRDMELHASRHYSPGIQLEELEDPSLTYLIAEVEGTPAAFAMIGEARSDSCRKLDSPIELFRFYVLRDWHGKGIAVPLMDACYEEARARGGRTICLSVWQKNPRAIRFYEKAGYRIAGTQPYILGTDVQTDWVMTREVPAR
jgi:diamine N-acetyltransferase